MIIIFRMMFMIIIMLTVVMFMMVMMIMMIIIGMMMIRERGWGRGRRTSVVLCWNKIRWIKSKSSLFAAVGATRIDHVRP